MRAHTQAIVLFALLTPALLLIVPAGTAGAKRLPKVDVCHVPPGNPDNAHLISVSENAVTAHVANHGDEVVPGDGTCSVGVGECVVDSFFTCTSDGLICDAEPADPTEEAESTCDDGRDNDCDGLIDTQDDDCPVLCCDPTLEPGVGGNAICFEGHTCCGDGTWRCNDGADSATCDGPLSDVCGPAGWCRPGADIPHTNPSVPPGPNLPDEGGCAPGRRPLPGRE